MLPVIETKHVETARALLIGQFKKRTVIQGFLDTYVRRVQDAENVLWDVIDKRILATAVAGQLDVIGKLVGEKRLGRTDVMYRGAIRLRVRVNRSKGRIADIIDVAMLAAGASPPRVTEYQYLAFEVELYNQIGERYVAELLSRTRAATSYGLFTASDLPLSSLLSFDDAVTPVAGIETFSDAVSGTGKLAASGYGLPTDFSGIVLGAPAVFDPATLALSAWYRASFAGSPWAPVASAGISGTQGSMTEATNPPATGAALNGLTPADFDGTNDVLSNANSLSTFIGAAAWSIAVLINPTATAAVRSVGAGYSDPAIIAETTQGYWYLTYTTSGVTVGHYDSVAGVWKEANQACSSGSWHLVQAWFDGVNISISVDSVAATSVASTNQELAGVGVLKFGDAFGAPFYDGLIAEVMLSLVDLGAPARADIKSYVNSRCALAL